MGLYEDTHITQGQFSWLGSIFYIGYLAFQVINRSFVNSKICHTNVYAFFQDSKSVFHSTTTDFKISRCHPYSMGCLLGLLGSWKKLFAAGWPSIFVRLLVRITLFHGCISHFSHRTPYREASTYPCIFLLISTLYRRQEQVVWFSTMFICNAVATGLGALIGYGIRRMHGLHGISAWQW